MIKNLEWWSESLGRIELQITREDAESASHSGQCDADVSRLRDVPYIREQLDKLSPALVVECLREYGAWDAEELADHENNLDRLLWCACCDISEECFMRESEED
jgi:hypothetical protein